MIDIKPRRAFDVRVNASAQGVLLVRDGQVYELGGIGAVIWQACDGEHTVDDIVMTVQAEYEVSHETALDDVSRFVGDLRDCGLIED